MCNPATHAVSVVTPAFNAAHTLDRACRSLAAQRIERWEHIIVDDGSTDHTAEIAHRIAAEDPRVRVFSTPNRGQGAALNTGLTHARAPFIAFLDADDEYLPEHLGAHLECLERNPDIDLLWGGVEVVAAAEHDAYVPDVVRGEGYIHASECIVQGTLFGRRAVFDALSYTEDRSIWYTDFEFVQRAAARFRVERFPGVTYRYYRDSSNSLVSRAKAGWTETADGSPSAARSGA